jgi:hypothetical protein
MSISSHHTPRNAFTADFLSRLDQAAEPDGTHEADVAGPWVIRPLAGGPGAGAASAAGARPADHADRSAGPGGPAGDVEDPRERPANRQRGGFALLREWESLEDGDEPYATFDSRELALIAAAILPTTGREPLFRLATEPDAAGFPLLALPRGAAGGRGVAVAGHLRDFDEDLAVALNFVAALARSPRALARLLEAAGHVALEQAGSILHQSIHEHRESEPREEN